MRRHVVMPPHNTQTTGSRFVGRGDYTPPPRRITTGTPCTAFSQGRPLRSPDTAGVGATARVAPTEDSPAMLCNTLAQGQSLARTIAAYVSNFVNKNRKRQAGGAKRPRLLRLSKKLRRIRRPQWRRTIWIIFCRDMCVAKNTLRGESVFPPIYGRKNTGRSDFYICQKRAMPFFDKLSRRGRKAPPAVSMLAYSGCFSLKTPSCRRGRWERSCRRRTRRRCSCPGSRS